jgi:hypothetical protein
MASVYVNTCSDTAPGQQWTAMADGRIAVAGSSPRKSTMGLWLRKSISRLTIVTEECLDLQYMRATQNNPVGMYSCAGLGNIGAKDKGINWPLVSVPTFQMRGKTL